MDIDNDKTIMALGLIQLSVYVPLLPHPQNPSKKWRGFTVAILPLPKHKCFGFATR